MLSICYFQTVCFYTCRLPFHFPPRLGSEFFTADLRRVTFPLLQVVYTQPRPAFGIRTLNTSVPFITHPSQNDLCPWRREFGCISNYHRHFTDPQGHSQDEKRCRCEEVPFFSINILFTDHACLSEEQEHLYPLENITDTDGTITCYMWITFIIQMFHTARVSFPWVQDPLSLSYLWRISLSKFNILVCVSYSVFLYTLLVVLLCYCMSTTI